MLSIDLNSISAIYTDKTTSIERVYVGSDLVWTDAQPFKFMVELSSGELCAVNLSDVDTYGDLTPFSMTYSQLNFSDYFKSIFNVRAISDAQPIVTVYDNQSTNDYGIHTIANMGGLSDLTAAYFPKTKIIYSNAFKSCKKLQKICLTNAQVINDQAFSNCTELTSIELPNLSVLGDYAFINCDSIISIDFGQLKNVPSNIFGQTQTAHNSILRSILMPNVTTINSSAFKYMISLESVYSPNLQYIDSNVFLDCSCLTELDFDNVISIGNYAFANTKFSKIILPKCEYINEYAFNSVSSLQYLYAPSIKSIGLYAFAYNTSLSNVNIPSVENIKSGAFYNTKVNNIIFNNIQTIESGAFISCDNLESITIYNSSENNTPVIYDGITNIDYTASIPRKCIIYVNDKNIYDSLCNSDYIGGTEDRIILLSCKDKKLAVSVQTNDIQLNHTITVDKTTNTLSATVNNGQSLTKPFNLIYNPELNYTHSLIADNYTDIRDIGANISALNSGCFEAFTNLSTLHLPNCINIGENALKNCSNLIDINFESLQAAAPYAFYNTGISSLNLPNIISCDAAFISMQNLKELKCDILQNITQPITFRCNNLTSIELPSISSINESICDSLINVTRLILPSLTNVLTCLSMPGAQATQLSALNLASMTYDEFVNISSTIASDFTVDCSLTCNDGIYTISPN